MTAVLMGLVVLFTSLILVAVPCIRRQRQLLGMDGTGFAPIHTLRWSGALFAGVLGPLLCAKLLIMVLALGSDAALPAEGAGMFAGIGFAWLVLPMALLVIGTAALKLPAAAIGRDLDTQDVIRLADGREWSLLPMGMGLALAMLLLVAGAVGIAVGRLEAVLPLAAGMFLLRWLSQRIAIRYRGLVRAA
ncbi:MAG: hypothetical protein EA417_12165 [Gammaproteobacteria bacterium]|nr:MAG: hypothetical protein EA417_12165 [Gammaproteobacteria bacterium]